MTIKGLNIIGERINPGFKSSLELLEKNDIAGLQALALQQVEKGAMALNINVGDRAMKEPTFMTNIIEAVQDVVAVPLSFDFPNVEVQRECLKIYDQNKAGGKLPIVNSISELRWDMLDLLKIRPFKILLMASERVENGNRIANKTADEVHVTTKRMVNKILSETSVSINDIIVDVSIGPVGADTENLTRMAVDSIKKIGLDDDLKGIHMSVGLSNISIMLPKHAANGTLLKPQIESAFLTLTVPYGLDHIIGTSGRNYELLEENNMVMKGFKEAIELDGFDTIMRIQEIYSGVCA